MEGRSAVVETESGGLRRIANRAGITLAFFTLGLASLKAWASLDVWFCASYPDACKYSGKCPGGLDQCPDNWLAALVLLGPEIAFAIAGFAFAGKRRSLMAWFMLTGAMIATHGVAMLLLRLLHL